MFSSISPRSNHFFSFNPGISFRGTVVRIVENPWGYLVRVGATAVAMAVGVTISIALLRRFRGVSIGWKPIVIGWLAPYRFHNRDGYDL